MVSLYNLFMGTLFAVLFITYLFTMGIILILQFTVQTSIMALAPLFGGFYIFYSFVGMLIKLRDTKEVVDE